MWVCIDCALMCPSTRGTGPGQGDGKRPLAWGMSLGESADRRHWHAWSCGTSG